MNRWLSSGNRGFVPALALAFAALCTAPARGQAADTFGTSALSYVAVGSNAFIPVNNTIAYLNNIFLTNTQDGDFTAAPLIPSGALLDSIRWTFCSDGASTAGSHGMQLVRRDGVVIKGVSRGADPIGPGCTDVTDDLSDQSMVVDNRQNRVELTLTPRVAADQFTMAVVAYRLQVSPPPAAATFGDVPTSHPFFRYVEALAASGITGGCGAGNFCPDAPVTRGQMAVFLAKALGLQWP
jgi:hypothetical protein